MTYQVRPLTSDLWPALEAVMPDGARGCWCMYWRIGRGYRDRSREQNRRDFEAIVRAGPPPGLIAFAGEAAVGWCGLTPRSRLPTLAQEWRLRTVDAAPVWSISCLYTRKGWRRKGVNAALIMTAADYARAAGAPALEACPFDREVSPSATGTGFASTFSRLGFQTVVRRIPARPIMRLAF
jgi:GNAT superfamily N-acetyltransferase